MNQNVIKSYGSTTCKTCGSKFEKSGPRSLYCAPLCKPGSYDVICERCGNPFNTRDPRAKLCSRKCQSDSFRGKPTPKRKRVNHGGIGLHPDAPELLSSMESSPISWLISNRYIRYYWPKHPKSDPSTGAIHEHRAVGYALWGDAIDGMHIDHVDANRSNNDPSNLRLLTPSEHMKKTADSDGNHALAAWLKEKYPDIHSEWTTSRSAKQLDSTA